MQLRILKILLIILILLYHSLVFSKTNENKNFNHRYLSSYFSAQVSHQNGDNGLAIKYFNSTKNILRDYPNYFDQYVTSLVLNNEVQQAIKEIKFFNTNKKIDNFQTTFLLTIDALRNKNYDKANDYLLNMKAVFCLYLRTSL